MILIVLGTKFSIKKCTAVSKSFNVKGRPLKAIIVLLCVNHLNGYVFCPLAFLHWRPVIGRCPRDAGIIHWRASKTPDPFIFWNG
jgi:hypothetical protein